MRHSWSQQEEQLNSCLCLAAVRETQVFSDGVMSQSHVRSNVDTGEWPGVSADLVCSVITSEPVSNKQLSLQKAFVIIN